MPWSFCTVCRRRIPSGSRCSMHAVKSPSNRNAHTSAWVREIRPQALARAEYRCQHCRADISGGLQVHHMDLDSTNNDPLNLIVLCGDCHTAVHQARSGADAAV